MSYEKDRAFSDRFIPTICGIVGRRLLVPSPFEVDTKQAADLVVLTGRNMTIACRVRKAEDIQYQSQFTIRSRRSNGTRTELAKVLEGWGDWMFYGFAAGPTGAGLADWVLLDLSVFRATHTSARSREIGNRGSDGRPDGTFFTTYWIETFPSNLVIDRRSPAVKAALLQDSKRLPAPQLFAAAPAAK